MRGVYGCTCTAASGLAPLLPEAYGRVGPATDLFLSTLADEAAGCDTRLQMAGT